MHLYLRIALLMAIALMAKCSEDEETDREGKGIFQEKDSIIEVEQISQGYVTLRDGRRIKNKKGARTILDFDSGICSEGSCMSQKDCSNKNGTDSGVRCVGGFGVCCITDDSGVYRGGSVTIKEGGGVFKDPEFQVSRPSVTEDVNDRPNDEWTATLIPPAEAVQIKIEIISLDILGPVEGDCSDWNDTLVINGANPGFEVPIICGKIVNPQTLYVDIDNSEGPYSIVIKTAYNSEAPFDWLINVNYVKEADVCEYRCLQYHNATEGTIESLNFDLEAPGMMLNNQAYSICFGYVSGYCDIAFNFARLDMGDLNHLNECTTDYLLIGNNKYCGDDFDRQIIANATGPINIGVITGDANILEEEGFSATYVMLGC